MPCPKLSDFHFTQQLSEVTMGQHLTCCCSAWLLCFPVCQPGYGGLSCATQCGGIAENGTYGDGFRPLSTPCAECSSTNLTVNLGGVTTFLADPSSRPGASSVTDCLSLWASYGDSWYLPDSNAAAFDMYSNITTLSDCLALCSSASDCQVATYLTTSLDCRIRRSRPVLFRG